ncbi:MAG: citramalate synthase, partial [Caldilinea sp.]
ANPKDTILFERLRKYRPHHAKLVAFGSTRRPGKRAEEDPQLENLIKSGARVITIFGKSWDFHVTEALKTSLEENLSMVYESVSFLKKHVEEVVFDAEHFFDGYKNNPEYALEVLRSALYGGADWLVLCDTNGGCLPHEVYEITKKVKEAFPQAKIGIHAHNDSETGVANSLMAVLAGARQVHGTINGIGERTGNANLCSIIPNLQLKMGYDCVPDENLRQLVDLSRYVSEMANLNPDMHQPFVGQSAFAHKGGTHVNAVVKYVMSYQHIDPALIGNETRVLVSELSGKDNIAIKRKEFGLDGLTREEERRILQQIKELENAGFAFESAEASVDLMLRRARPGYQQPFELIDYTATVEHRAGRGMFSEATVKVRVGDRIFHEVSEGNGPVNALNRALRKAILPFYPRLRAVHLTDYKVRILDSESGTAAMTRVLIDFSDGDRQWTTVGASTNIIEASWIALSDSVEYYILTDAERHHVEITVPELVAGDD